MVIIYNGIVIYLIKKSMDPLIELVTLWTQFISKGNKRELLHFAEYLRERPDLYPVRKTRGGEIGVLARIIGRIGSAYGFYHR